MAGGTRLIDKDNNLLHRCFLHFALPIHLWSSAFSTPLLQLPTSKLLTLAFSVPPKVDILRREVANKCSLAIFDSSSFMFLEKRTQSVGNP